MSKMPIYEDSPDDLRTVEQIFATTLASADIKFRYKSKKYGDSWRRSSVEFLEKRLRKEIKEWKNEKDPVNKRGELIDIILIAIMLESRSTEEAWAKIKVKSRR